MSDSGAVLLRFDKFELDEANAQLLRAGASVDLPPKAFAVLCALARTPGRLVTKDTLLDAVWGHRHVSESVLKTTISQLRAALDDDPREPRYIETAARRGYRFIAATPASTPAPGPIPAPALQPALPPLAAPIPSTLVGRHAARQRLQAAWAEALQGRRQVVWLAGEPGVGKTSLIDDFVQQLGDVAVAHGQCVEPYGAGEPYLPILDALAALCRHDPAMPSLLRSVAPTWLLQLPWLVEEGERGAVQGQLAGASQDRMLREMGELLDRYTATRPLLLVTEDLHWSDHATVRLLDHVARRRGPGRLMWLGSFRPAELITEDHPLKGLRQELRAHRLCQELMLEPFSEHEVAAYLAGRWPDRAGWADCEEVVRALHAHTDGLPLFLVNVVDDLQQQGVFEGEVREQGMAAALSAQRTVPESLAGVIEKQISRLPDEQRQLLAAGSACGVLFRPATAAAALQRDADWAAAQCDALLQGQHWLHAAPVERRADGSLDVPCGFRHALYRQVFYERSSPASRAMWHQRIGQSLLGERAAGRVVASAELAMHFERGHVLLDAVRHYADAAGNAMGHFAPHEAARYAERGLALLQRAGDGHAQPELELMLTTTRGIAATQLHGVASPEAMQSLERARVLCDQLPPAPERTWVLNGLGWIHYTRGEFAEASALARRVYEHGETSGDAVLQISGSNLLGVVHCNSGDLREARSWLERGIALCADVRGDMPIGRFVIDPELSMRANLCQPLMHMGLRDLAEAQSRASFELAERVGQPIAVVLAYWCACMLAIQWGDVERTAALAAKLAEAVERHAVGQGDGPQRWYRGWALAHGGNPEAGHKLILEGYECHARLGMYTGCPLVLGYAADALALQGDHAGALAHVADALALADRIGETLDGGPLLARRARSEAALGDTAAARASLQEAIRRASAIGAAGDADLAETALRRL